jgi:hypothetical protein
MAISVLHILSCIYCIILTCTKESSVPAAPQLLGHQVERDRLDLLTCHARIFAKHGCIPLVVSPLAVLVPVTMSVGRITGHVRNATTQKKPESVRWCLYKSTEGQAMGIHVDETKQLTPDHPNPLPSPRRTSFPGAETRRNHPLTRP